MAVQVLYKDKLLPVEKDSEMLAVSCSGVRSALLLKYELKPWMLCYPPCSQLVCARDRWYVGDHQPSHFSLRTDKGKGRFERLSNPSALTQSDGVSFTLVARLG